MSTNIEIIKGVRCYVDKDNVAQLNLEDVANGLGFTKTDRKGDSEYKRVTGRLFKNGCKLSEFQIPKRRDSLILSQNLSSICSL